ncbi:MAG: hypothetical protein JW936_09345 [Sedimentisphaerales bacterium]|nr:hypothetical protein [Sedimentisphaerales bacterium]
MPKVAIKELSLEAFNKYGAFANMINPNTTKLGAEPIEFYRDMVPLDLGGKTIASFSICRVLERPPVVDIAEFHTACGEGILPLDGDILIHVGVATPNGEVPVSDFEIFRIPKGTFVSLKPGVWHHAPFAYKCQCANTVIVLPERTYANDCYVYDIPKADQLEIDGM